jgi:hypothetical protein
VFTGLRAHLTQRDRTGAYVKEYNVGRRRLAKANDSEHARLQGRRGEVDLDLKRAADPILQGACVGTLRARTGALAAESNEITRELSAMTDKSKVIVLHPPQLTDTWPTRLNDVMAESADGRRDELTAIVRRLIITVRFTPSSEAVPLPRVD